jgi:glycosyltransferase involved in cell wall biosynthesis
MKVFFIFEFTKNPKGGVFQFTKALMNYLISLECVTDNPEEADIFFISAFQFADEILFLKRKYPNKIFVHRLDGPIRLYNRLKDRRDYVAYNLNYLIADGTIFQSSWSKRKNLEMGLSSNSNEATIYNAPNSLIFNTNSPRIFDHTAKTKIIATSWSSNWKKGFEVYKWLDENLDFNRYEMSFIGNSPIEFKNIVHKEPMNSEKLSFELKRNDIFITASQSDPCSNSLIEALHCGLPAIGLNDGGHTEIIANGGEVFDNKKDIPRLLEKIIIDYQGYQKNISLPSIEEVGQSYFEFLKNIHSSFLKNNYTVKKINHAKILSIKISIFLSKVEEKFSILKGRMVK